LKKIKQTTKSKSSNRYLTNIQKKKYFVDYKVTWILIINIHSYFKELILQQKKQSLSAQSSTDSVLNSPHSASQYQADLTRFASSIKDSNKNAFDFSFNSTGGNAFNILENLQSKLKQKDGEILQLQVPNFSIF